MTATIGVPPGTRAVWRPRLSGRQLAKLRALLADAMAERRWSLEQHQAILATLPADLRVERDLTTTALDATQADIDEIENAIEGMNTGSYGVCEACGMAILYERLEAIPHARHCVGCP